MLSEGERHRPAAIMMPRAKSATFTTYEGASISMGRLSGNLWEQTELPLRTKDSVLLNLCNAAPMAKRRQIVVIHDTATLSTPQNYSREFRAWYSLMLSTVARRAAAIATVSNFSAGELMRHFQLPPRKITVVPESGEHISRLNRDERVLDRLQLRNRPFVLAVGSRAVNKNLRTLEAAIAQLEGRLQLVTVGGTNSRVFDTSCASPDGALQTGYVTDPELAALYAHALCFVFPSLYEGYGLPPLEAMSTGCPVIVSDIAALRETCGDAAGYCDPADPTSIADAIRRVATDHQRRDELIELGLARAAKLKWAQPARILAELAETL